MDSLPVTVLMSVYNGRKFLKEAIDSILQQTFTDFEFLIIDDGSSDGSVDIITSYHDNRIRLIRNQENLGLTKSLNKGITLAQGKYIARMDADDISASLRLEKQVEFMGTHTEVGVCGSWFSFIDAPEVITKRPTNHYAIKINFLRTNPIGHPTAIIRKSILEKFDLRYDANMKTSQDYDLWERMSCVSKLANIPEVLLFYRRHQAQVTKQYNKQQQHNAKTIRKRILKKIEPALSDEECVLYESLLSKEVNIQNAATSLDLLKKLVKGNSVRHYFEQTSFISFLSPYFRYVLDVSSHNPKTLLMYTSIPGRKYLKLGFKYEIKFIIKCILYR